MLQRRLPPLLLLGIITAYLLALALGYALVRVLPGYSPDLVLRSGVLTVGLSLPLLAFFIYRRQRIVQVPPRVAISRGAAAGRVLCSILALASLFSSAYFSQSGHLSLALLSLGASAFLLAVVLVLLSRQPQKGAA